IYKDIRSGDQLPGFIKKIREENKLDISLQAIGYAATEPNAEHIIKFLTAKGGKLNFSDKSTPESIYESLEMSKKNFKKAIGLLYKQKRILILEDAITLV
ncbi:MAG: GntR family transcriptional regulator, partial [Bacteroidia bacterium]|nr:GntR family transcriptional regulator [Bacteroidia bacterium]